MAIDKIGSVMRYRVAWAAAAVTVSFAVGAALAGPEPWHHEIGRDHPLTGQIFSAGRAVEEADVIDRLVAADFILLGEKHDNIDHHRLQARLLGAVVARGRPVGVAFEAFSKDHQAAIDDHITRTKSADGLDQVVSWAASGWPDWAYYRPLVQAAVAAGAPILAANWPRADLYSIFESGSAVLPPALVARSGLDRPLDKAAGDRLRQALVASHCGMAPEAVIVGMTNVQRARDALMAERLASLPAGTLGVLIAGTGHVRRDYGVPFYLRRLRPGSRVVSLAFREIELDVDRVPPSAGLAFDYVWMTPRVDNDDPCQTYRQQLKSLPGRADN